MLVIFEVDYIILCTVTSVFIAEAVEKHRGLVTVRKRQNLT